MMRMIVVDDDDDDDIVRLGGRAYDVDSHYSTLLSSS
jgi:hypothetical protein